MKNNANIGQNSIFDGVSNLGNKMMCFKKSYHNSEVNVLVFMGSICGEEIFFSDLIILKRIKQIELENIWLSRQNKDEMLSIQIH